MRIIRVEGGLTFYEHRVLDTLDMAERHFAALPEIDDANRQDFSAHIRILRRHVMARVAERGIQKVDRDEFSDSPGKCLNAGTECDDPACDAVGCRMAPPTASEA